MVMRLAILFAAVLMAVGAAQADEPVKVFILAGQSNMQGHGRVDAVPKANDGKGSLEWLVRNPETKERFVHLVDDQGEWIVRDDVHICISAGPGACDPALVRVRD